MIKVKIQINQLRETCIQKNYFKFNNRIYRKKDGLPILILKNRDMYF